MRHHSRRQAKELPLARHTPDLCFSLRGAARVVAPQIVLVCSPTPCNRPMGRLDVQAVPKEERSGRVEGFPFHHLLQMWGVHEMG
jgi:hypothetical protein